MSYDTTNEELNRAIKYLEENISSFAPTACERHVFEVLKDLKVQATFIEALKENFFEKVNCKGEHDQIKVTFIFKCKPPKICFIAPFFDVTYDLSTKKVVDIKKIGF